MRRFSRGEQGQVIWGWRAVPRGTLPAASLGESGLMRLLGPALDLPCISDQATGVDGLAGPVSGGMMKRSQGGEVECVSLQHVVTSLQHSLFLTFAPPRVICPPTRGE